MDQLRALAETRGFFTRAEVLALGHDDRTIARAVRSRSWVRIRPGAFTARDLWPDEPERRHQVRGRVVSAKLGPAVALSHTTAAIEHGLRLWGADLDVVHVTRLDGGAGRTEAGVVHHEGLLLPEDLRDKGSFRVTSPTRSAIETASLLTTEAGLVVLDSVLQLAARAQLDATWGVMKSWPGMRSAQICVRMADAGAQSVGESRARHLFFACGLPAPVLQYAVHDDTGALIGICDFAWPGHRLLGEFDGRVKYGRYLRPGEEPGDAVFREKRREDRLCEQLGWRMVRITWADLSRPAETAARVGRLLRSVA
jgi:hypothetical protein